jgi:hypothetical protein
MFYPIFDIITIGLPFCVFKITTGLIYSQQWLVIIGLIDLAINTLNLLSFALRKKKIFDTCLLSFFTKKFIGHKKEDKHNWKELGESLDVLLSFSIVAYIIGSARIVEYPHPHIVFWNWAVVLNVLGAGSARMIDSVKKVRKLKG